jgi:hypothetical protein
MAPLLWLTFALALVLSGHYATIAYALYQNRGVKVGLKIPFVECSFEAKDKPGKK